LALGQRAVDAKLLLFGTGIDRSLAHAASTRTDVEVIDLDRLYYGD